MTLAPLPLHRFPLCRSSDVHEFTDRLNGVHHPATVVPGGDVEVTPVEVTPVEVTPVDNTTTYHVDLALAGWLVAVSGSDEVPVRPGHASVHGPRRAHVLRARAGSELHRAARSRAR